MMSDVGDVGIVTGIRLFFGGDDDVVDEINNGH
jgi:hypothetical protein